MPHKFADIMFTDTVKSIQTDYGSRKMYTRMEEGTADYNNLIGPNEAAFISARDSLYMATINETGWPYVQHRGGPLGFVKILDEKTLAMPDFRGNRQYVSVGNLTKDDRVSLFFMDYPNKTRLKLLGRVELVGLDQPKIIEKLQMPDYRGHIERGYIIKVEAFDWNCPQHITQRYTVPDIEKSVASLQDRIIELETELSRLKPQ
ncbi:MAG: pyridoxamine 5'-phosphate oxidase family protein [Proteobacteria bacterium]|nr:pyridoxamine 5'-phosphate oxidase family protein [Pseudomonadota bacterium]